MHVVDHGSDATVIALGDAWPGADGNKCIRISRVWCDTVPRANGRRVRRIRKNRRIGPDRVDGCVPRVVADDMCLHGNVAHARAAFDNSSWIFGVLEIDVSMR